MPKIIIRQFCFEFRLKSIICFQNRKLSPSFRIPIGNKSLCFNISTISKSVSLVLVSWSDNYHSNPLNRVHLENSYQQKIILEKKLRNDWAWEMLWIEPCRYRKQMSTQVLWQHFYYARKFVFVNVLRSWMKQNVWV